MLDERLQAPNELSGLLNRALGALEQIEGKCAFSTPDSVQAAWQDFHATTDPLAVWLDRYTIEDPDAVVVRKVLRVSFNAYLERQGRPTMSNTAFGVAFGKLKPHVAAKQRTVSGKLQWCYVGIGLLHGQPVTSQTSQGSRPINQSHEISVSGSGKEREKVHQEQSGENPVKSVNPVKCNHTDPSTFDHREDGAYCRGCGKWMARTTQ